MNHNMISQALFAFSNGNGAAVDRTQASRFGLVAFSSFLLWKTALPNTTGIKISYYGSEWRDLDTPCRRTETPYKNRNENSNSESSSPRDRTPQATRLKTCRQEYHSFIHSVKHTLLESIQKKYNKAAAKTNSTNQQIIPRNNKE